MYQEQAEITHSDHGVHKSFKESSLVNKLVNNVFETSSPIQPGLFPAPQVPCPAPQVPCPAPLHQPCSAPAPAPLLFPRSPVLHPSLAPILCLLHQIPCPFCAESPALCTSHRRQSCPARPSHHTPPTPLCCTKSPAPFCARIACALHRIAGNHAPACPSHSQPSYPPYAPRLQLDSHPFTPPAVAPSLAPNPHLYCTEPTAMPLPHLPRQNWHHW
ncbi:hypothetical protein SLEP1_g22555 [Rubroshorea leprosula]|uniref:Uncharacterized protein n=1 Tax=Rubroshorea leprosula TaxID=152421 RepID=A0AAV5JLK0_9ROSI|nr:hypothetical protein SLEP1_g22555 [Rubroshorea leprosula]